MGDDIDFERDVGRLVDMLENARTAIDRVRGRDWDAFVADATLCDAVIYRLGIVGEASVTVSAGMKLLLPELPWQQIKSMRNILFHDYKGVELRHVWEVTQVHAPELVRIVEQFLTARGISRGEQPRTSQ
jgi:uncharacterized protein with HEPN domain